MFVVGGSIGGVTLTVGGLDFNVVECLKRCGGFEALNFRAIGRTLVFLSFSLGIHNSHLFDKCVQVNQKVSNGTGCSLVIGSWLIRKEEVYVWNIKPFICKEGTSPSDVAKM